MLFLRVFIVMLVTPLASKKTTAPIIDSQIHLLLLVENKELLLLIVAASSYHSACETVVKNSLQQYTDPSPHRVARLYFPQFYIVWVTTVYHSITM